ncbi:MAG: ASKHA domain-containing protein, partial [Desulfovibrionaceae bacterium]
SLAARLRQAGLVDAWGRFAAPDSPLGKRLARSLVPPGDGPARDLPLRREPMLDLGGGLFLPASDLEEIVKVKAAFNAAVSALLQAAGLRAAKLSRIFLAGALGVHAQPADLEALGFLPPGAAGLASPVGDAALRGLELTLDDPAARAWIEALPGRTRVLDLPADPRFQEAFAKRLSLDYT